MDDFFNDDDDILAPASAMLFDDDGDDAEGLIINFSGDDDDAEGLIVDFSGNDDELMDDSFWETPLSDLAERDYPKDYPPSDCNDERRPAQAYRGKVPYPIPISYGGSYRPELVDWIERTFHTDTERDIAACMLTRWVHLTPSAQGDFAVWDPLLRYTAALCPRMDNVTALVDLLRRDIQSNPRGVFLVQSAQLPKVLMGPARRRDGTMAEQKQTMFDNTSKFNVPPYHPLHMVNIGAALKRAKGEQARQPVVDDRLVDFLVDPAIAQWAKDTLKVTSGRMPKSVPVRYRTPPLFPEDKPDLRRIYGKMYESVEPLVKYVTSTPEMLRLYQAQVARWQHVPQKTCSRLARYKPETEKRKTRQPAAKVMRRPPPPPVPAKPARPAPTYKHMPAMTKAVDRNAYLRQFEDVRHPPVSDDSPKWQAWLEFEDDWDQLSPEGQVVMNAFLPPRGVDDGKKLDWDKDLIQLMRYLYVDLPTDTNLDELILWIDRLYSPEGRFQDRKYWRKPTLLSPIQKKLIQQTWNRLITPPEIARSPPRPVTPSSPVGVDRTRPRSPDQYSDIEEVPLGAGLAFDQPQRKQARPERPLFQWDGPDSVTRDKFVRSTTYSRTLPSGRIERFRVTCAHCSAESSWPTQESATGEIMSLLTNGFTEPGSVARLKLPGPFGSYLSVFKIDGCDNCYVEELESSAE